jgi:hypothetical protein
MSRRLNNGNYKTTSIRVYHPDDGDVYTDVSIYFKWHYYHGEVPSFDNPYGSPAEYDFELIKYSKSEEWITQELVEDAIRDVEFRSLLEEDYSEY